MGTQKPAARFVYHGGSLSGLGNIKQYLSEMPTGKAAAVMVQVFSIYGWKIRRIYPKTVKICKKRKESTRNLKKTASPPELSKAAEIL